MVGETTFRVRVAGEVERVDFYLAGRLLGTARPPDWALTVDVGPQPVAGDLAALAFHGGKPVARAKVATGDIGFVGQVDVVAVQLYPVVTSWGGKFERGLKREDFEILDRGRPVTIDSFSDRASTLSLALVVDTSASMVDNLTLVQEGAVRFLSALGAADEVSVYGFNQTVQPKLRASKDLEEAKAAVRSLQWGGGTALYDALVRVIADLEAAKGRKALVVFSDGQDERSLAPLATVVERARQADVLIYAIGAGESDRDLAARGDLRTLAEESGGEVHYVEKFKEIPGMFARIAEDLRAQYSLGFLPEPGKSGVRPIEVRVKDRSLQVRCRKSYYYEEAR